MKAIASPILPENSLPIPIIVQETDYSCGVAAFRSLLKYWHNQGVPEKNLYKLMKTSKNQGTTPDNIALAAEYYGLKASVHRNEQIENLITQLQLGTTVIIDLQAYQDIKPPKPWKDEWESGHYVVLMSIDNENIYFMDPSSEDAYSYLPISELPDRWHDYEIIDGVRQVNERLTIYINGNVPSHGATFSSQKLVKLE